MQINYMVVRKRDDQPVEVLPFEDFDDAVKIFENMRLSWTETYICCVIGGEGHALKNEDDLLRAYNRPKSKLPDTLLNFMCYLVDNCEGEIITEEHLLDAGSKFIKSR